MAVGDVYATTLSASLLGVRCVNSWDYVETVTASATLSIEATINLHVKNNVIPKYRAALCDVWVPQCIETELVAPGNGSVFVLALGTAFKGDKTTEPLPPNAVACASEYTTLFNQAGRGRHYFSGFSVIDESDNCWNAAAFGELTELAEAIASNVQGLVSGTIRRCIYARAPPFPAELRQFIARPQVRSFRRRTMKFC